MEGGITSPGKLGNVRHPGWDKVSNSKCDQTVWPPAVPPSLSPVIFVFPSPRYSSPIWLSQNITFPEKGWPVLLTPFCVFIQMQFTVFLGINCSIVKCQKIYASFIDIDTHFAGPAAPSASAIQNGKLRIKWKWRWWYSESQGGCQVRAEVLHSDTSRHRTLHRDKPSVGHSEITIVTIIPSLTQR